MYVLFLKQMLLTKRHQRTAHTCEFAKNTRVSHSIHIHAYLKCVRCRQKNNVDDSNIMSIVREKYQDSPLSLMAFPYYILYY